MNEPINDPRNAVEPDDLPAFYAAHPEQRPQPWDQPREKTPAERRSDALWGLVVGLAGVLMGARLAVEAAWRWARGADVRS